MALHLEKAFSTPGLVEIELTSPRAVGQPKLHGKILLLPLRDDHGRVSRMMGFGNVWTSWLRRVTVHNFRHDVYSV